VSDVALFAIGMGVFAITFAATLLYGYFTFYQRSVDEGGPEYDG